MKFQTYLIKYGEIGIKGKNRYMFEDALVRQQRQHEVKQHEDREAIEDKEVAIVGGVSAECHICGNDNLRADEQHAQGGLQFHALDRISQHCPCGCQ